MKNRSLALDFWKFIASIIISLLHYEWHIVPQGYLSVELFFLIAGYLIYSRRNHYQKQRMCTIFLSKITSIYTYWIIIVTLGVFFCLFTGKYCWPLKTWAIMITKMLLFIPYLLETKITSIESFWLPFGQLWYIPVWLFVSLVAIVRIKNARIVKYSIALFAFLFLAIVYNATNFHGLNITVEQSIGMVPFGVVRGLQDIFIGLLLGIISEDLKLWVKSTDITKNGKLFFTIIELGCILVLFMIWTARNIAYNIDYLFIAVFSVILLMNEIQLDYISTFLNTENKYNNFYKLSTPIYFYHFVIIQLMSTIGLLELNIYRIILYLVLVMVLSIVGLWIEKGVRTTLTRICHSLLMPPPQQDIIHQSNRK